MDTTTLVFGKVLSLYLMTAGIAFIVATPFYAELTRKADKSDLMAVNISGMVHLLVGFSVVANHFIWDSLLAILVTLMGLFFVIRGLTYYWVPQLVLRPSEARESGLRGFGAVFIAVGALMGYLSFFA